MWTTHSCKNEERTFHNNLETEKLYTAREYSLLEIVGRLLAIGTELNFRQQLFSDIPFHSNLEMATFFLALLTFQTKIFREGKYIKTYKIFFEKLRI